MELGFILHLVATLKNDFHVHLIFNLTIASKNDPINKSLLLQIKMLDYRQKRLEMEPVNFNNVSLSSEELDHLEFRRVICKGYFDKERSIYVGPRSRSISGVTENGYYVITPLVPVSDKPER